MEIRLTSHAALRHASLGLSREEVAEIIEHPDRFDAGATANVYDARVRGALYRAVVVRGSEPPLVITVFEVDR